jgi:ribosomal protein S9
LEALNPPLAKSDMLQNAGAGAACWIRKGLEGKIVVNGREFENAMPPNLRLSATEITNILNYIHNAWGNTHKFITLEEVNKVLEGCK